MRGTSRSWVSRLAASLALVVGLTLVAPPASMAADVVKAPAAPQRLAAAAAAKVDASPAPLAFAQAQAQAAPAAAETGGKSFFRTPTGIAAIVLMVAGATYVAVSIRHDNSKVHSPIR